jgi:hypothetical protein
MRKFTQEDVDFVISDFKNKHNYALYNITAAGRIRFDAPLNMDITNLNAALSRPIQYQADWEQLKKQVRQQLTLSAVPAQ